MSRLRRLGSKDVVRVLKPFGFAVVHMRGSHIKLRRITAAGTRQTLTVPDHKPLDIGTTHTGKRIYTARRVEGFVLSVMCSGTEKCCKP